MAWAIDLDGVMWRGAGAIEGSAEAVQRLQQAGEHIVFVTNNSYLTVESQTEKLRSFGVEEQFDLVTSAEAAASLIEPDERVLVLGGEGLTEAVTRQGAVVVDTSPANTVVVGLDKELSYTRLSAAVTAIIDGARFIASNTDATYPTSSGLLPGAGPTVAAVSTATGCEPIVAGKPHQTQADLVKKKLGSSGIMVGDRPETDGLFAQRLGYKFGLVLTGVTQAHDLPVKPDPDVVGKSLLDLVVQHVG